MSTRAPDVQPMGTPNPRSVKFITDRTLLPTGSADFRDPESARRSPLAMALFDLDDVEGVFLCQNFVTVTATSDRAWHALSPAVVSCMKSFLLSGQTIVEAEPATAATPTSGPAGESGEVVDKIREIIDTQIRPAVAMDGGDIVFVKYDQGVVLLSMQGACGGCPSSTVTLKAGIEARLKHLIPEIKSVEAV